MTDIKQIADEAARQCVVEITENGHDRVAGVRPKDASEIILDAIQKAVEAERDKMRRHIVHGGAKALRWDIYELERQLAEARADVKALCYALYELEANGIELAEPHKKAWASASAGLAAADMEHPGDGS